MKVRNWLLGAFGVGALLTAGTASAYDDDGSDSSVFVYAQGGGISAMTHFDPFRDSKFRTAWTAGGGVGLQLNKYVALRGNFLFGRSRAQDLDLDVPGLHDATFNRYIYGGDLQLSLPIGGVTPYVIAGGGGITFSDRTNVGQPSFTRGFGRAGVGLIFPIARSPIDFFVQGAEMVYSMNQYGPNRTLWDTTWTGGLRLRVPM
jgi:hypothetical protein